VIHEKITHNTRKSTADGNDEISTTKIIPTYVFTRISTEGNNVTLCVISCGLARR